MERRSQDGLKGRFKQFKVAGSSTDTCGLPCSLLKKKVTTARRIGCTGTGTFLTGFKADGFLKGTLVGWSWFSNRQCHLFFLLPQCQRQKMAHYSTLPNFSPENLIPSSSASALAKTVQPFPGILLRKKYIAWHALNKSRQPFM